MSGGRRPGRGVSLRLRLTLLYASLLAAVFITLGVFVYTSLRRIMLASVDLSLENSWRRAVEEDLEYDDGEPTFIDPEDDDDSAERPLIAGSLRRDETVVRIVSADGAVESGIGPYEAVPVWPVTTEGFSTRRAGNRLWRTYARPLAEPAGGGTGVWLQAARSLDAMAETLHAMLRYLLVGLPALLAFSSVAGFLLSAKALRPIVGITRTAAAIDGNDLSRRIGYRGSAAEIVELAASFDRMLDRLEGAFTRERRFTSDAAHELRTPLTALKGQIEVALGRTRSIPEYRQTLAGLQQYVDRLIQLANDLLLMARMDRGTPGQRPVRILLGELLDAVVEQMDPVLQAKRLRLTMRKAEAVAVRGDMDRLIRLFLNLMENAAKYTPEDGSIEVELGRDHGQARVSVSNTGPGIPKEDIPFVFDRFYRVDTDRSRQSGGAGLGLAIAREIALYHGGGIAAESTPGERTTFTVLLPADAAGT